MNEKRSIDSPLVPLCKEDVKKVDDNFALVSYEKLPLFLFTLQFQTAHATCHLIYTLHVI